MKKYKLLNTKGLLLTLGSAAAIIAPIATVVSCGGPSSKTMDKGAVDQQIHQQKINLIHEAMFKELSGWGLSDMDIFERVFNTEDSGMLNVARLNKSGYNDSTINDSFIDKTLIVDGKPQHIESDITKTVPAFKLNITKRNIVSNKDELKEANKKITDFIASNPGEYAARVVSTKTDSKDSSGSFTLGEYQIQMFKKLPAAPKTSAFFALLSDKSKMSVDTAQLQKAGGTYLMGLYAHEFGMGRGTGYDAFGTKVTQKGTFGDRSNENNLKSWTAFGPTSDTSISDADISSVSGLHATQILEEDKKTHVFTLVSTVSNGNTISTHYLPLPELNSFSNKQHDMTKIVDILTGKLNFAFYYDFLKGMDTTAANGAGSAKRHIIDLAALLPEMAKVSDLLHDSQFVQELLAFINSEDPGFSFATFQTALENMENNKFEGPDAFGPKTYELIHFNERFYTHVKTFLLNNPTWASKAIQIKDAESFFNQQKAEAEYRQYLEDHKATLTALNLQSTSDKAVTRTEIEYFELNQQFAKEVTDAIAKLGSSASKTEIIAEVKLHVDPLATLQTEISAHAGQSGWTAHDTFDATKPYTGRAIKGIDEIANFIKTKDSKVLDVVFVVKSQDANKVVVDIVLLNAVVMPLYHNVPSMIPLTSILKTLPNIEIANLK